MVIDITKNYNISGHSLSIKIHYYTINNAIGVVASSDLLNYSLSFDHVSPEENDTIIINNFSKVIKKSKIKRENKKSYNAKNIIIIENPDTEDIESVMIAVES